MKKLFDLYAWLALFVLFPIAVWAWWQHYDGNLHLTAVALAVPVIHAYVVPAIGVNVLGVWQFKSGSGVGRIRPHHGFVFGSATALLTLAAVGPPTPAASSGAIVWTALSCGFVLLCANWIYDAMAIRAGYLQVFNQPWADGSGPWAITADYAVWFFGLFGLLYGTALKMAESVLLVSPAWPQTIAIILFAVLATSVLPALGYCTTTLLRHGHAGLRPCAPRCLEGADR